MVQYMDHWSDCRQDSVLQLYWRWQWWIHIVCIVCIVCMYVCVYFMIPFLNYSKYLFFCIIIWYIQIFLWQANICPIDILLGSNTYRQQIANVCGHLEMICNCIGFICKCPLMSTIRHINIFRASHKQIHCSMINSLCSGWPQWDAEGGNDRKAGLIFIWEAQFIHLTKTFTDTATMSSFLDKRD